MINALIFDLDDTLYDESEFVEGGYRAVASYYARHRGLPEERVFIEMMETFKTERREKVFEMVLARFLNSSDSIKEMVDVYRRHTPTIRLLPGYEELLRRLHSEYHLGIITDGLPEVQKLKVEALRLEETMDKVVYTWEYGPELQKPHPFGFQLMLDSLGIDPVEALFIGDNPRKDCRGAHNAGLRFVKVNTLERGENSAAGDPAETADFAINNLHALPALLQRSS